MYGCADSRAHRLAGVFAARTHQGISGRTTLHTTPHTHIMDVDEDSASSPGGRFKGFYIYVISRRLAGPLINFKESDWSRVPKF